MAGRAWRLGREPAAICWISVREVLLKLEQKVSPHPAAHAPLIFLLYKVRGISGFWRGKRKESRHLRVDGCGGPEAGSMALAHASRMSHPQSAWLFQECQLCRMFTKTNGWWGGVLAGERRKYQDYFNVKL